jgi:tRNA-Thr(GGU) m(6)t(6)A37 methyltransferase TsaA
MTFSISPIGFVKTPFQEKFGVPRQSGMIPEARGILKLNPDPDFKDALRFLETFSHVWLIFQFHEHANEPWRKLTTTPRVGAPERVGVFASRSPHRPNGLGMSAVKLDSIDFNAKNGIEIHLSGLDLLDGTPVFDLKPYVPFVDSIPDATGGFTLPEIPKYAVEFSGVALETISKTNIFGEKINLKMLITQMLEFDPRPTPQKKSFPITDPKNDQMKFAFRIGEIDVHWQIQNGKIWVNAVMTQS